MPLNAGQLLRNRYRIDALLGQGGADEQPQHSVAVPDFEIARFPVTNAQYLTFVQATGRVPPRHWPGGRLPEALADHPVTWVDWRDAQAYVDWLCERSGLPYRLPTEAEWEKAARGTDQRLWPWGNDWDPARANGGGDEQEATTPVGLYSPHGDSPFGCADMAGNVWEWCSSEHRRYPYRADDGREKSRRRKPRVMRGGSWSNEEPNFLRSAFRAGVRPDYKNDHLGFRIVKALPK